MPSPSVPRKSIFRARTRLVAAGLLATAFHTAHEAGWLNAGQATALDLTWLVRPGTILAAVLTGVLGLQAQPTVIEAAVWLLYLLVARYFWRTAGLVSALALAVSPVSVAVNRDNNPDALFVLLLVAAFLFAFKRDALRDAWQASV